MLGDVVLVGNGQKGSPQRGNLISTKETTVRIKYFSLFYCLFSKWRNDHDGSPQDLVFYPVYGTERGRHRSEIGKGKSCAAFPYRVSSTILTEYQIASGGWKGIK